MHTFQQKLYSCCIAMVLAAAFTSAAHAQGGSIPRFEIKLPASHNGPATGRVFVIIAKAEDPEPRLQVGSWRSHTEFLGKDVVQLQPGETTSIDALTIGYPFKSVRELPAGDYYVQAVLNVYTRFSRADGHIIWAHNDQWEGQQFNRSPGNLYSLAQHLHLDPVSGYDVRLELGNTIPPTPLPSDTQYVKHIKMQSKLLTQFWGQPIYLGATVLLPQGYEAHPEAHYPVLYEQGHFGLQPPLGFSTDPARDSPQLQQRLQLTGYITGYDLYKQWIAADFPRMIVVTFQHPTVYFDDSYAVNSANNGPYGDAIMTELIPYLEEHFRMIRQPYARMLSGGSTGGWESLALQVFHPDFFGGTWTFFPDPVDFTRYQMVDIYADNNAFVAPGYDAPVPERAMQRTDEGQVLVTMREMSQLEEVLGSHGRSAQQFEAWEAVYGPVGADGYPKPLWDKLTGRIDPQVANYMRDHGYDLRYYLEQNWPKIGSQLAGKLHLYCGDMDNFYLNLAVYRLEDFLKKTNNPAYGGSFEYGRPMKGHGWHPMDQAQLLRIMAESIATHSPAEGDKSWRY
ncbi:MAG TPA: alpha/beta hydrolase-fold protein [Candidatus Angelobacter sp.]|nr:alpha/beta hydrolase-fold protein [Candidatus Angelobacter sp.]